MRRNRHATRIAVLGGGLQGCCLALALAQRGFRATIFEREQGLLCRTLLASEGKIHLGYVYAGDESLQTARTMIRGALAFAPFIARALESPSAGLTISSPFAYAVHRTSFRSAAEMSGYLQAVHDELLRQAAGRKEGYFGIDLSSPPRARSASKLDDEFDPRTIAAVFDTVEVAVRPKTLAEALRLRIESDPSIEVRTDFLVTAVTGDNRGYRIEGEADGDGVPERYDHVVNALWAGRLAIDRKRGLEPGRPWLHRFKYGIQLGPRPHVHLPSATVVLGPFGDVVSYGDGSVYLSWYPTGMTALSAAETPPDWPMRPEPLIRDRLIRESVAGMAGIVPALRSLDAADLERATAIGGVIVAWGKTDIDDPQSELHQRRDIGIRSEGCYHSIDPGKLTMVPYFAELCAARIAGE
jgi:glycine/D-amino acid oxidase-like deaminating enzyme